MKILVTGHRDYLGSVLVPWLAAEGHECVGLDCDLYRDCDFGDAPLRVPELEQDVRDVAPADLEGCDGVVHLPALSNDPLGNLEPALTDAVNRDATVRLARLASRASCSPRRVACTEPRRVAGWTSVHPSSR